MRLIRMLRYNYKVELWKNKHKFLLTACLFFVSAAIYNSQIGIYNELETIPPGVLDYILFLFMGIEKYIPVPGKIFPLPIFWMIFHISCLYAASSSMSKNKMETQVLLQTGGYKIWWYGKCVWTILCNMLIFVIGYSIFAVFTWLQKGSVFDIGSISSITFLNAEQVKSVSGVFYIMIMPLLTVTALSMLQNLLALFLKPILVFLILSVLLFASAFCYSPILLGNYSMLLRSHYFMEKGITLQGGILGCLFTVLISVWIGKKYLKTKDFF